MNLFDIIRKPILKEGGNLSLPGGHEAQQIDLKVHNRNYIVPILDKLLQGINNEYSHQFNEPLWNKKVLQNKKFLSGSSLHFFDTNISDDEFIRVKPKVGDIDTQVNKDSETNLEQFLSSIQGKVVGNAKFLGFQRGNEQFSSLWELTDPPIKVQIDLEFVAYDKEQPTDWAGFSHSSSWEDLNAGIKGVFHKYLIQSFTKLTTKEFLLRKLVGRGKARTEQDIPTTDNMFSFAVSSKEGGGLRPKYEPVLDEKGRPLEIGGLPVMRSLPASGYEQDIGKIFQSIFDTRVKPKQLEKLLPKTWSFTGLIDIMNIFLSPEEKEQVMNSFVDKLFAPGAQGLYKNDADRDTTEKNSALNYMVSALKIPVPNNLEQMRQEYRSKYKVATEGPMGLDRPVREAEGDNQPTVKAQLRKGMPHLRDLKPVDFLDLIDELHDGNNRFKLQNIPLNVKVDGFGGRFGKNAEGKPFMGTSRTEPRYEPGFLKYHQEKGTTDPEILNRAQSFDDLFNEMMNAIKVVDQKLGPDFLVDKQVTCEVLFLPFAKQTDEGKLKFVGIEYDQLPKNVNLVLVPFRVVEGSTGEDVPNGDKVVQQLANLGQNGTVAFMSNRLVQKQGLDVTEIINLLDNIEELKTIVSDTAGKRDKASLQLRKEVEEKLKPVQVALEKAIDEDPNIVGKDMLGQDYEGIVINSRLGPIKVTSQRQKDIITAKNAAKAAARAEHGRDNTNKTAVVAIGSFVGHIGHEQLFDYTIKKAAQVGGDPYLFIGNAQGKDDPIPPNVKVQTWHKMYPQYAKNISTVTQEGGSLMQKIKHELINPLPGKAPRYDNIIIMVGEDQANMPIAQALMKAVNKFPGYEHVRVSLEVTPRGTGMSFTKLRNILKDPNATEQQQLSAWSQGFDIGKLGVEWIKHLMDLTRKGMGIQQPQGVAEGIGKHIAGAALAGAMALGGGGAHAQSGEDLLPDIVAHVTFKVNGNTVTKDINLGTNFKSPGEASAALEKFLRSKGIKYFEFDLERKASKDSDYIEKTPVSDTGSGSMDSSPAKAVPVGGDYMAKEGIAEGAELKQAKRKYNQAAKDANADQVGAGKKIDTMKKSLRQKDLGKEQGVAEGEADYGADYQDKVKRLGQMARQGERKTVWDPVKRVYKTVPVNAPKKDEPTKETKDDGSYAANKPGYSGEANYTSQPNWRGMNIGEDVDDAMARAIARLIESQLK
jgi:hypothetical protein